MKSSISKKVCLLLALSLLLSATVFVGNGLADTEPDWVVQLRNLCDEIGGFNIEITTVSGSALKATLTHDNNTTTVTATGTNINSVTVSDGSRSQTVDLSNYAQFYNALEFFGFDFTPEGKTMLRSLCDEAGVIVGWDSATGATTLSKDGKTAIASNNRDGTATISCEGKQETIYWVIIVGRTYGDPMEFFGVLEGFGFDFAPEGKTMLRLLCDEAGITVGWDPATRATTLSKDGKTAIASNNGDGTATISCEGSQKTIYWVVIAGRTYGDPMEFFGVLEGFGFDFTPEGKSMLRLVCDEAGITVGWDPATRATTLSKNGKTTIASNNGNGTATISCEGRQETIYWVIIAGRTYVDYIEFFGVLEDFGFDFAPEGKTMLRLLCDEAGIAVGWDPATRATSLSKDGKTTIASNNGNGTATISYGSRQETIYWVIIVARTYVDKTEFIAALQTIGLLTDSTGDNDNDGNNNDDNNDNENLSNVNNSTGNNGAVTNTTTPPAVITTVSSGNDSVDSTQTNKLVSDAINSKETSMTVELPTNAASAKFDIADINLIKENNISLSIAKEGVTFTIPSQNIAEYVPADSKEVILSVKPVDSGIISDLEKDSVAKDSVKAIFDLEFIVDNTKITDFNTKPLNISISADESNFKSSDKLTGFRLNDDLSLSPLGGSFNPKTNCFEFVTDHLSTYGVMTYDKLTSIIFTIGSNNYSLNGKSILNDVAPFINSQDYTLVPLRAIAESLGAKVDWSGATNTATITMDGKEIKLTIGVLAKGMSTPAVIQDGRTMVPLRYVSESLGASVVWDGSTKTVSIYKMN